MKTTQRKAVAAFIILNSMSAKPMSSFTAYKLFRLKKALRELFDFQVEEETKKVKELGGEIAENGSINLPKEATAEYEKWHKELGNTECEVGREKTEISMKELKDITLNEMEILDEFIEWKE